MRYFFFLILLSLALPLAAARAFFPHDDGMRWTYDNGEIQELSGPYRLADVAVYFERTVDAAFADYEVMKLSKYFGDILVSEDFLIYEEDAVYTVASNFVGASQYWYNPPMLLYQGNRWRIDDSWESVSNVLDDRLQITLSSTIVATQAIEIPVGRFNAWVIHQNSFNNKGVQNVLELYFVPTIGIVRFQTMDGGTVNLVNTNF